MPDLKSAQYLALRWIYQDSPNAWFADFPILVTTSTAKALIRREFVEQREGRYRLTPLGREEAMKYDGGAAQPRQKRV